MWVFQLEKLAVGQTAGTKVNPPLRLTVRDNPLAVMVLSAPVIGWKGVNQCHGSPQRHALESTLSNKEKRMHLEANHSLKRGVPLFFLTNSHP